MWRGILAKSRRRGQTVPSQKRFAPAAAAVEAVQPDATNVPRPEVAAIKWAPKKSPLPYTWDK